MPGRMGRRLGAAVLALLPSLAGQAAGETPQQPAESYHLRGLPEADRDPPGRIPSRTVAAPTDATGQTPAMPDRVKLKASLIEATAKLAATETAIADAQARLDALTASEAAKKGVLEGRQAVVAELLAALQRMGRKPPPALLVDPGDALKAVRSSMLLGAVLPGMRADVDRLLGDLAALARAREDVQAAKRKLDADLAVISDERERLGALVALRQNASGSTQAERDAERDKARQVAEQAGSFKDLLGRMERDSAPVAKGAEAARRADALAAPAPDGAAPGDAPGGLASSTGAPDGGTDPKAMPFKDPARLAPAIAFAATKGLLPVPVSGTLLRRFGEDDGLGGTEKGALFATLPSAVVASPADGWIAYAGPYRSYGQLLILNTGAGYYIVLAGMERINVDLGQFVLAGEPIAIMGDGSRKTAAAIALGAAQPVLYVEFRKDGATIDPGPWWAKPELQKVRG